MALRIRHIATRFALLLGGAAVAAAARLRRRLAPLAPARHARVGHQRQPERRHPRRRGNPPLRRHQRRAAQGARRRPAGHRPRHRAQQDRILKNYVLQFREFREITLFDEAGATIATSRVGKPRVAIPKDAQPVVDGVAMSPIRVDDDLLPTTVFAIHLTRLEPAGRLARRRVQPRRNVADGRQHPHRRARLRAGRRARTASWSRTATRTRRRSSRRRAT